MMSAIVAYMYRKRRLGLLRQGFGPNSNLSSDSETESESENDTSDDLHCNMDTSTSQPNSSRTNTNPAGPTSVSASRNQSKNLQGIRSTGPVARPSAHTHAGRHQDRRIVKTNRTSLRLTRSATKAQGVPESREVAVTRKVTDGSCSPEFSQPQHNLSNGGSQSSSEAHAEKVEACSLCSLLVPCSDSDINRHELIYHMGTSPPNCRLIFDTYQSLLLNNVKLLGSDLTICAECRMSFSVPSELLKHLYTHAVVKSRSIDSVQEAACASTTSESSLVDPTTQVECQRNESTRQLDKSDAQLPTQSLGTHLPAEIVSNSRRRETAARIALITEAALKQAQQAQEHKDMRSLCQICGNLFKDLRTHIDAVHKKLLPYKCPLCEKRFARRSQVLVHSGNHKPFYCKICHKYLKDRYFFKQHMAAHNLNGKPFKCDQCDKSFMRRNYLKAHQVLHTGRKPFPCSLCPKGYMCSAHLEVHMKSHYGIREHKCPVCFKEFFSRAQMNDHMRSHKKSHLCEQCGKAFVTPYKLRRHVRNTHDMNKKRRTKMTRSNEMNGAYDAALNEGEVNVYVVHNNHTLF